MLSNSEPICKSSLDLAPGLGEDRATHRPRRNAKHLTLSAGWTDGRIGNREMVEHVLGAYGENVIIVCTRTGTDLHRYISSSGNAFWFTKRARFDTWINLVRLKFSPVSSPWITGYKAQLDAAIEIKDMGATGIIYDPVDMNFQVRLIEDFIKNLGDLASRRGQAERNQ